MLFVQIEDKCCYAGLRRLMRPFSILCWRGVTFPFATSGVSCREAFGGSMRTFLAYSSAIFFFRRGMFLLGIFLCSSWVTEHIDSQTSSLWQAACTNSCMPKQKLARKPPRTPGRQGQIQSRGPHDPEHQQGEGPQPENNRNSKPNAKVGGVRPKHK